MNTYIITEEYCVEAKTPEAALYLKSLAETMPRLVTIKCLATKSDPEAAPNTQLGPRMQPLNLEQARELKEAAKHILDTADIPQHSQSPGGWNPEALRAWADGLPVPTMDDTAKPATDEQVRKNLTSEE